MISANKHKEKIIMDISAIVLAAEDGSRMKSNKPKAMCGVLGDPMIDWVLDSIAGAGIPAENTAVIGDDTISKYISDKSEAIRTFSQIKNAVEALGGDILVIRSDAVFADDETIKAALNAHRESGNDVTVISAVLPDPARFDRIIRAEDGSLEAVKAFKDCTLPQLGITEVSAGICWIKADALAGITDISRVSDIAAAVGKAGVFRADDHDIVLGADSRAEMLNLNIIAKMRVIAKHLNNGVEFVSTDGVIIGRNVEIGRDTCILPGTILRGKTVIGESCTLGPNTLIENCKIGDGVTLNSVQAYDSRVCDRVKAGPFVQLRPGTVLHEGVKIGDFVEVKNSEIGVNTAIAHLTYVGDSDVGKGVNFGCGCVTANYDGINKYRTKIGDYAFIGCNTNLIAPVEIGENATTAAGSTITKSVPPDSLAVERAQTKIIDNWEKNFLRKKKA